MKCVISVYTQTEVSDMLQISEGMSTNVSKKRKIEEGNLQKVKADVVIAACT